MEINKIIEELKDDLIDSTAELIKIKSIEGEAKEGKPYGEGVANALEKALEISEKLGFKTVNVDGYVGYAEYGPYGEGIAEIIIAVLADGALLINSSATVFSHGVLTEFPFVNIFAVSLNNQSAVSVNGIDCKRK